MPFSMVDKQTPCGERHWSIASLVVSTTTSSSRLLPRVGDKLALEKQITENEKEHPTSRKLLQLAGGEEAKSMTRTRSMAYYRNGSVYSCFHWSQRSSQLLRDGPNKSMDLMATALRSRCGAMHSLNAVADIPANCLMSMYSSCYVAMTTLLSEMSRQCLEVRQ